MRCPLCDVISKGYCVIWGGISHWAARSLEIPQKSDTLKIALGCTRQELPLGDHGHAHCLVRGQTLGLGEMM